MIDHRLLRRSSSVHQRLAVVEEGRHPYGVAELGAYFRAVNSIPGTGIAQGVIAAFAATAGLLRMRNGDIDRKRIFLDYIRLIPTVVPTSATRSELLIALDDIVRFSSGGSTLTPRNVNMDEAVASVATVNFGQLTLAAEGGNVRRVSRAQIRTAIPVAFEEVLIAFGIGGETPQTLGGTTALRLVVPVGPCIIGPGDDFILHVWHPGNATTGASWEAEVAWWERDKAAN